MTILDKILNTKLAEVEERKRMFPVRQVERMPFFSRVPLSMSKSLINGRSGIIAEFKRKSPSKGFINEYADVSEIVAAYAEAGASACSVLTDFSYFGGTLADLTRARETVSLPLLRKDFIVDAYQLFEAKGAGADRDRETEFHGEGRCRQCGCAFLRFERPDPPAFFQGRGEGWRTAQLLGRGEGFPRTPLGRSE